ncbi:MAG: 16S rRNA (guanine(527)-N(7))-methyltransferase RsmG [Bacteroidetes bacterium]|nr:MAG: 16S rRNA (guanine(527)-N(7))-methyltransferase RsmG [Bacteroidota bacterium]
MDLILKYFPELTSQQIKHFEQLMLILPQLNERVNVISRKDIAYLEERHILHSLSIAKLLRFDSNARVLDVGTGGGFPGIPLALMFPEASFTLVDSIRKKISLVSEIVEELNLKNVTPVNQRMEQLNLKADFVVSRAVTAFPKLHLWTQKLIEPGSGQSMPNGLISLKGGDLNKELMPFKQQVEVFPLSSWYEESFFSTKMIVYLKK